MKKLFALLLLVSTVLLIAAPSCSQLEQVDEDIGFAYSCDNDAIDYSISTENYAKELPPFLKGFASYDIEGVAMKYEQAAADDVENNKESRDVWEFIYAYLGFLIFAVLILYDAIVSIWPTALNWSIIDKIHKIYRLFLQNRKKLNNNKQASNSGLNTVYQIE